MNVVTGFFRFWYDFIVGDDWRVAVAVVVGLVLTAVLARAHVAAAWLLLPVVVLLILGASLWRAAK